MPIRPLSMPSPAGSRKRSVAASGGHDATPRQPSSPSCGGRMIGAPMGEDLASPLIRGWCPGALRPMASGDGLIVRLRISGGILSTRIASEIARWAARWGNGHIDLTGRGNLQLRGLSPPQLPDLHE